MLLFPLLILSLFGCAEPLASYTETQVLSYIDSLKGNSQLSPKCSSSLRRIPILLESNQTLDQQRQFFYGAFASGEAQQFVSRDLDRWFYKSMECLKVAGQTPYSSSEYPFDFCFGANKEQPDKVYGVCIPTTCEADRLTVSCSLL